MWPFGKSTESRNLVSFNSKGDIKVSASSPGEAKLALRELRFKRKELGIENDQIMTQQRLTRADHVRHQGSKRASLEKQLQPLEVERIRIEARAIVVGKALLQVEDYIMKNTQ